MAHDTLAKEDVSSSVPARCHSSVPGSKWTGVSGEMEKITEPCTLVSPRQRLPAVVCPHIRRSWPSNTCRRTAILPPTPPGSEILARWVHKGGGPPQPREANWSPSLGNTYKLKLFDQVFCPSLSNSYRSSIESSISTSSITVSQLNLHPPDEQPKCRPLSSKPRLTPARRT